MIVILLNHTLYHGIGLMGFVSLLCRGFALSEDLPVASLYRPAAINLDAY